jgi:hypothetical protein
VPGSPLRVHDVVTGDDLWERPWGESVEPDSDELRIGLAAGSLLVWDGTELTAHDIWTGEELWRQEFPVRLNAFAAGLGLLATWSGGELELHRVPPREPLWRATIRGGVVLSVSFHESQLLVRTSDRIISLDLESGSTRWSLPGRLFAVDEHGVLRRGSPRDLTLHDLDSQRLWAYRQPSGLATLLPDRVLVGLRDYPPAGTPFTIDRATGEQLEAWSGRRVSIQAVARARVYGVEIDEPEALVARSLPGNTVWQVPFDQLDARIEHVVPVHRGLVALTGTGTLIRL